MPSSSEIRQQFLDFFLKKHDHRFTPSSPVVPFDDPTLLFANAGMNQFKPCFLGTEQPDHPRAANTQKCIRAGGKHNDLDDVGKDTYHHTFFEMLGNWSFGDYFKKEAIDWAWELLVDVWGLDPDRLHATYFEGDESEGLEPDREAKKLWLNHLPEERIHPGNKKDNFWEMGDTGPCGPCSEIHYDGTADLSGATKVNQDDPDVIEIWNLVFIQFNRSTDGKLSALPAKHVDTGMGFERVVRVLQAKNSNYDTDVWTPLFDAIHKATGARKYTAALDDPIDVAYRVIADHARCLTFALTDGAAPGNEGRSYVLRRILRRAVRYGRQTLGKTEPFIHELVPTIVETMGEAFPELQKNPQHVIDLIKDEEESFIRTLDRGIELFSIAAYEAFVRQASKDWDAKKNGGALIFDYEGGSNSPQSIVTIESSQAGQILTRFKLGDLPIEEIDRFCKHSPVISAADAFKLYDTHGFPLDLTQLMAEERGMSVDVAGFEKLMEEQRQRARAAGGKGNEHDSLVEFVQKAKLPATEFVGYTELVVDEAELMAKLVINDGRYETVEKLFVGEPAAVVVSRTPFYAESGGQVGDAGVIRSHEGAVFNVEDTIKIGDVFFHLGSLETGSIKKDGAAFTDESRIMLEVDADRRAKIAANHTTTHIMNRALRSCVNDQADQRGSLVDDEKTRFDFSHNAAMTTQQAAAVEAQVNADIEADLAVDYDYAPQEDALKINGLRAVFGEKYPPTVRVVSIGPKVKDLLAKPDSDAWAGTSIEFCGGTHLKSTGAAEQFAILSEEAVAKGVRRVTAVTGKLATDAITLGQTLLDSLASLTVAKDEKLAKDYAELSDKVNNATVPMVVRAKLREGLESIQKKLKATQKQAAKQAAGAVVDVAREIASAQNGPIVVAEVAGADGNSIRQAMDVIRKTRPESAILLGAANEGKVAFIASVPEALIAQGLKAGDWVREVAKVAGGGGGGRPDNAQAGGKDPDKLPEALEAGREFARSKVG